MRDPRTDARADQRRGDDCHQEQSSDVEVFADRAGVDLHPPQQCVCQAELQQPGRSELRCIDHG